MSIKEILTTGTLEEQKALFVFDSSNTTEEIVLKFNLWARKNFPQFFTSKDASFHKEIDTYNVLAYRGEIKSFTDIAFRGAAKTSRTKLFLAFAILNDLDHSRKYIKVLSADLTNSRQIVTDVYNMLITCEYMYPEVFKKSDLKREETMGSFTTATDVKMVADTVGTEQRGALQNESRPDLILFEDIETRMTLRSAVKTKAIWDNMEEARTALSIDGACIYNCNYVSERGNVHKLVQKKNKDNIVLIIPILKDGHPTWPERFSLIDIQSMKEVDDDFEGERLCKPSSSRDVLFDRDVLDKMTPKEILKDSAGFKIYYKFDPSHRYASGHDVSGGVGLDSSTSIFIDFDTVPARVVATYKTNELKPDTFGYEIRRQSEIFGGSLTAIEKNNHGHATIAICKQEDVNQYYTRGKDTQIYDQNAPKEYGWHTNALTKPKMLFALAKAVADGHIDLTDPDLIAEASSYSRDDLMDREIDPRLTTRHFDLLIACAIAYQMKDYAETKQTYIDYEPEMTHSSIGI